MEGHGQSVPFCLTRGGGGRWDGDDGRGANPPGAGSRA